MEDNGRPFGQPCHSAEPEPVFAVSALSGECQAQEVPEPYRPSNGTEGAIFMSRWCDRCERDRDFRDNDGDSCPIAAATMIYRRTDPEYPKEWREDGPEGPRCTAFRLSEGERA